MSREEIREGIAKRLLYHTNDNTMLSEMIADNLLFYLHSQGVVILHSKTNISKNSPTYISQKILKAGYVAVESLIEEE